jgi:hypothetical protein
MSSEDRLNTVRRLIEESSLGTEGAKALRARTPRDAVMGFFRRCVASDGGSLGELEPIRIQVGDASVPVRPPRGGGPRRGTGAEASDRA